MATVTPPVILWFLLVSSSGFPSMGAVSEFCLAVSGPSTLQLSPSLLVEKSPGSKPGTKVNCARILIHGLPRIKNLKKFAKDKKFEEVCQFHEGKSFMCDIKCSTAKFRGLFPQEFISWDRDVSSRPVGKVHKGVWIKSMSPFDHKILDIRMAASHSENIQVSIDEVPELLLSHLLWLPITNTCYLCHSSTDPLLAADALVGGIFVSSLLRRCGHPKAVHHVYKKWCRQKKTNLREPIDPYASPVTNSSFTRPSTRAPYTRLQGRPTSMSPKRWSDSETFYSTFHDTPDRRKFAKGEWESFTMETTRVALEGLVSSSDFSKWAVSHADRITLAPKKEVADTQKRWFRLF